MEQDRHHYNTITIDSNILKSSGHKFDEGLLSQLSQFKVGNIRFVLSDIVHFETIKHIATDIARTRSDIKGALRSAEKQLKIDYRNISNARELLSIEGTQEEVAEQRLRNFYNNSGALLVNSSEFSDIGDVVKGYFQSTPPFEPKKKSEFPDAIALSGLERWAEHNDANIVVVTEDSGWQKYIENSRRMMLISDLSEALEFFQPHKMVSKIISWIRGNSLLGENEPVIDEICTAISDSVNGAFFHAEGSSHMQYETNDEQAFYVSHEFDKDEHGIIDIDIVRLNDEEAVLKVGACIQFNAEAGFDFIVHDRVDNDYTCLGGTTATTEGEYQSDILITLSGDLSEDVEHIDFDDLEVVNIEVIESLSVVDFGEVEPDWHDDLYM